MIVLAGCSAYPQVTWPGGEAGPAPALLPLDQVLAADEAVADKAGPALAARVETLKARVAVRP